MTVSKKKKKTKKRMCGEGVAQDCPSFSISSSECQSCVCLCVKACVRVCEKEVGESERKIAEHGNTIRHVGEKRLHRS